MKKTYSIVTLILLFCVGVMFSGCGPDYSSLSLSLKDAEKIEVSINDEKADYYLTINNYFDFNAQFSFDFASNIAKIVEGSVVNVGGGNFKFSIAPIIAGSTSLTINLKGLNKPLIVPVEIKKEVESITASTNQFVKKGGKLVLTSSMFTFTPADTTEKGLLFSLANTDTIDYASNYVTLNEQTNELSVGADCTLGTIVVTATSTQNANIQTNIEITVTSEASLNELQLQIANQDASKTPDDFEDFQVLSLDANEESIATTPINLIISEMYEYQKKLLVDYELFSQGYAVDIVCSQILTLGSENTTKLTLQNSGEFVLSANDVGKGTLKFIVYQINLPENKNQIEFVVNVSCKPKNITVNGQTDLGVIELYTNSSEVKEYKFGVSPIKANKEDYDYFISYYQIDSPNAEQLTPENKTNSLDEFLEVKYGGALIVDGSLGKLTSNLTIHATNTTNGKYLAIKIDCKENQNTLCSLVLFIKVYVGTTKLSISDVYANGTIYMAINQGKQTFYGIECSEGSTPGQLSFSMSNVAQEPICSLSQPDTASTALNITPMRVGTQDFIITTPNNLSVVLKIVVFREIEDVSNLIMQIADTSNNNISAFEPKDQTQRLSSLTIKGLNSKVNLKDFVLSDKSDFNDISYTYSLSVDDTAYFEIENNQTIVSKTFTQNAGKSIYADVTFNVNLVEKDLNGLSLFKLTNVKETFKIELKCVNYIKQMSLYAGNSQDGKVKAKTLVIYNKQELSYKNQNLATAYLFLDLVQSEDAEFKNLQISNFSFKSGAEIFELLGTNIVSVGEIGYFYPNDMENDYIKFGANGYVGSFTYDYNNLRTLSSISIVLSLTDTNTNDKFSSEITLKIDKYIDVESIWLSAPNNDIYLDNTSTNKTKTLNIQILPSNAMCKDLEIKVETSNIGCIGYNIADNIITLTYQSAGSGKILIFPVSKMKTNSFTDEFGQYYYHLELNFMCSDGQTEQTALKISNLADLKAIVPSLHYYVDSTIDCQGQVIDIAELSTGSIRGTFLPMPKQDATDEEKEEYKNAEQIGSIINFKVGVNTSNNIGLFRTIGPDAKVYNISLYGGFNSTLELNKDTQIGILCGNNKGTITNVNVVLSSTNSIVVSTDQASNISVYFGIVTGKNSGKMVIDDNCKNSTMFAYNDNSSKLDVYFSSDKIVAYMGGIVGGNEGTIEQKNENRQITIGLFGISANCYITTNAKYIGGVVGENNGGTINNLKVTGQIDGRVIVKGTNESGAIIQTTYYSDYVAGFVAKTSLNANIKDNICRVFVRGGKNVCGFAGDVNNTTFTNNKVQAVDDGTRVGKDASLVIGYDNDANAVVYATYNAEAGVIAESYFDRTKEENSTISNNLAIEYYYGDVIRIDKEEITITNSVTLDKGVEDDFELDFISSLILSAYKEAENSDNQKYIQNVINTISLLKFTKLIGDGIKDININILNSQNAKIANFGQIIKILSIGDVQLEVSSALNYKKSATINLYITNHYDDVKLYANKDKTSLVSDIQLVNKKTTIMYYELTSNLYNYNNMPIALKSNSEVTFDAKDYQAGKFSAQIQAQTGYFVAENTATTFSDNISFVSKFVLNNNYYYKITNSFIEGANNKDIIFAFIPQDKIVQTGANADELETKTVKVNATIGIEDIKINKSVIEAEPSDSIELVVSFINYGIDEIIPTLKVFDKDKYTEYALTGNSFVHSVYGTLFTLFSEEASLIDAEASRYKQKFVLKMPIDSDFNLDAYNFLCGKRIELTFRSKNSQTEQATAIITYKKEAISSVLITNYSKEANVGMLETKDGVNIIYADKMLYTSNKVSTTELNVLNAYVYTKLSEFDYVDVTMNLNVEGAYLGYIEYSQKDGKNIGTISNKSVYTSITNGATLRIYKTEIKQYNNMLIIGIIYKIPKTVLDGTIVPIIFNFYSDNQQIFTQDISLLSKTADQVSFEIYNKNVVEETIDAKTYNVARGMKYLLDTTIVGYSEEEAVFESNNPSIASISKEGANYYLTISDASLNYGTNGYYEVKILSYGQKTTASATSTGVVKTTILHIYEFLVDEKNLFENDILNLRILEKTDLNMIIAEKVVFEYSKTTAKGIANFKQSLINNANYYIVENEKETKLTNGNTIETKDYKVVVKNSIVSLTPLTISEPTNYKFVVRYSIVYENGIPTIVAYDENNENNGEATFTVNTFIASTEQVPNPIYTYEDMLNMKDGEYYRQVSDIEIKASDFKMITSLPKVFDGNGYNITILAGALSIDLDESSDFALFKTVNVDCVIKNVSLVISGNLNLSLNNSLNTNGANIALLVAENQGIITNCSVNSTSMVMVDVLSTISVMENSYFAGLCANNSGYITNCRVECNLTANGASLGGFVAYNNGAIASSYIKNSRIYNTTSTTSENISTSGFVCNNAGKINMCFVEGVSSSRIFADYASGDYSLSSKIIYTATKVAGFVFENSGTIADCYANIPIVSSNESSGFVAKATSGTIERVFSLCKLKQQDTLNFGFVANYDEGAIFKNCFFVLQDGIINYNTSQTNYKLDNGKYVSAIEGVVPLQIEDFNIFDKNGNIKQDSVFKEFIVDGQTTNGVWFSAFDQNQENSAPFAIYTYNCEVDSLQNKDGSKMSFTARRLNLVAPNTIAYSKYDLILQGDDYYYVTSESADRYGSKSNPYVITTAKDFENLCYYPASNYEYYRLVCDIDYINEEIYSSMLYNKNLVGYFEGNCFTISNYAVNSIGSNLSAGLFASIGKTAQSTTCLKNVTFVPKYINLPNSVYVGGVAGTVANANVFNVSIDAKDVVIVGNNIVGGMFGRTYAETNIVDAYSNITAKASLYNSLVLKTEKSIDELVKAIAFSLTTDNKTKVSYAGAIIGYVDGIANIKRANVGQDAKTLAMIAGLMYGGVGSIANVSDFDLDLNSFNNQIIAYAFGGYVAGELLGNISNFTINSSIINTNLIDCSLSQKAVGGVAGYANGATISGLTSTQGYFVIGAKTIGKTQDDFLNIYNPYIAQYVGGVVGYANSISLEDITINNKEDSSAGLAIMGGNNVGGIVGYANGSNCNIKNFDINLISSKTYTNQDGQETTDKLYASYVSQAVAENTDFVFNEDLYFGLLSSNGGLTNSGSTTTNFSGGVLYVFYGAYDTAGININGDDSNLHICKYIEGGSIDKKFNCKTVVKIVNLSSGTVTEEKTIEF